MTVHVAICDNDACAWKHRGISSEKAAASAWKHSAWTTHTVTLYEDHTVVGHVPASSEPRASKDRP